MTIAGETQRLFVAIHLPDEVKSKLMATQRKLSDRLPPRTASWTRKDNLHLTLRFLGPVPADRVEALTASVRRALGALRPFEVRCERLGIFPDHRPPRIVWAGVHDPGERLQELQAAVEAAVASFSDERPEKRFTGHVTIARIRRIKRAEVETIRQFIRAGTNIAFGEWTVSNVSLMRSELSPQGSRYSEVSKFELRPGSARGSRAESGGSPERI